MMYEIYGMIEPERHEIVYIDYVEYQEDDEEKYKNNNQYFLDSIDLMRTYDENENPF